MPMLTGSGLSYFSVAAAMPRAASRTNRNSREAESVPQASIDAAPASRASIALRIKRRDDMARVGIEIVVRPVKVHGQQRDGVHAVLLAIGLGLHHQHFFRQAVGGVGFFGIAVPNVVFAERHGGMLWIRANRTDHHDFGHFRQPGFFQKLDAHDGVVVEKQARIGSIRADSADHRRQDARSLPAWSMRSSRRTASRRRRSYSKLRGVKIDDGAIRFQSGANFAAEKAGSPGDDDASSAQKPHRFHPLGRFDSIAVDEDRQLRCR